MCNPFANPATALLILLAMCCAPTRAQFDLGDGTLGPAAEPRAKAPATKRPTRSADVVKVQTVWSQPQAHSGDTLALAVVLDIDEGYHVNADQLPESFAALIATTLTAVPHNNGALQVGHPQYPTAHEIDVNFGQGSQRLPTFSGRMTFFVPVSVPGHQPAGDQTLTVTLRVQACNDTFCLRPDQITRDMTLPIVAPERPISDPSQPNLFADYDLFKAGSPRTASGMGPRTTEGTGVVFELLGVRFTLDAGTVAGLWLLYVIAVLGGLLLNFTPCVLPVIPIKIMTMSRAAGNRARCLGLGLAMSAGVVAFWFVLAVLIAAFAGFASTHQLFKYPVFTMLIGVLVAVMAVGMCGLFSIRLPNIIGLYNPDRETLPGSFALGVMTAILSTPCTAPFMGTACAWAVTQGPVTTVAVFVAIGVGMALPYAVLSAFPGLVERMPRTGPGSELLKQVMGLLMLAVAAYFIGIGVVSLTSDGSQQPSQAYWFPVIMLVVAAGGWLTVRTFMLTSSVGRRAIFTAIGLVIAALAIPIWPTVHTQWEYYTPQRYQAAVDAGRPVLLDFTAEWCLNCKLIEAAVLESDPVVDAIESSNAAPMKVDRTGANPAGDALFEQLGGVTIPLIVVLGSDGMPVLFSESPTTGQVVAALGQAR